MTARRPHPQAGADDGSSTDSAAPSSARAEMPGGGWRQRGNQDGTLMFKIMPIRTCFRTSSLVGRVGLEPTTEGL